MNENIKRTIKWNQIFTEENIEEIENSKIDRLLLSLFSLSGWVINREYLNGEKYNGGSCPGELKKAKDIANKSTALKLNNKGACFPIFVFDEYEKINKAYKGVLRKSFFLPLIWSMEDDSHLLPQELRDRAENIKKLIGEITGRDMSVWHLNLNQELLDDIDLSSTKVSSGSAWAILFTTLYALQLNDGKGVDFDPSNATASIAWYKSGTLEEGYCDIRHVDNIEEKIKLAIDFGIKKFFVSSKEELDCTPKEIELVPIEYNVGPRESNAEALINSLRVLIGEIQLRPTLDYSDSDNKDEAYLRCKHHANNYMDLKNKIELEEYLLKNIIPMKAEELRKTNKLEVDKLVVFMSSPSVTALSLQVIKPKNVLIFYTKQTQIQYMVSSESITCLDSDIKNFQRIIVDSYTGPCPKTEWCNVSQRSNSSEINIEFMKKRLEEFFVSENELTPSERCCVDITGGTKYTSGVMTRFAIDRKISVLTINSNFNGGRRIVGTEQIKWVFSSVEHELSTIYLCYDIKGIQQYIFSISKLKYIIGGSILLDQFDSTVVPSCVDKVADDAMNCNLIFSGGGRGTIECCNKPTAELLKQELIKEAHKDGFDLRIGISPDISVASQEADELYSYLPPVTSGQINPCAVSGLYPVGDEMVHETVARRRDVTFTNVDGFVADSMGERVISNIFQNRIADFLGLNQSEVDNLISSTQDMFKVIFKEIEKELPSDLYDKRLSFIRAVRAQENDSDDKEAYEGAIAADAALGKRNRWAVVAIDGNDIGSQFKFYKNIPDYEQLFWIKNMSLFLKDVTRCAFILALKDVILKWDSDNTDKCECLNLSTGELVLPFRPLIIGGDDIVCLAHPSYAGNLAIKVSEYFTSFSSLYAEIYRKRSKNENCNNVTELWPATGNELTVSTGIVYCKVTHPLHRAITYAESLLASAKRDNRVSTELKKPSAPAIDWENITEGFMDHPADRRKRSLEFYDTDISSIVRLSEKPYTIANYKELVENIIPELTNASRSVFIQAKEKLTLSWVDRIEWYTSIQKNNSFLFQWLDESSIEKPGIEWNIDHDDFHNKSVRSTRVLDAITLYEETHRLSQETV